MAANPSAASASLDMAGNGRLERLSLSEQALSVIRQAMIRGELRPGEIYSAAALASRLGVSNSPVREAMLTLVNEGLMVPVRNRGFQVVGFSDRDLEEIYEVRRLLEIPSMVEVARRAAEFDFAPLRELAERNVAAAAAGDLDGYLETDREFHLRLTELVGNQRLLKTIAGLRDHTRLFGLTGLLAQGQLTASAAEHVVILEAIERGDVEQTEESMSVHLGHIVKEWAGK
jgi:DNA-binding GntR family transcriptional regulator